ncbi:peptidase M23 [Rhodobacteraceae bacterium XHP0102]|nr:peptidase M23 [Rhodobacteraceae bacterium XHP0102]
MKNIAIFVLALIVASPAAAHEGLHLHPHGAEPWMVALGALGAIGLAALIMTDRRK